jgi:hypothetical protein
MTEVLVFGAALVRAEKVSRKYLTSLVDGDRDKPDKNPSSRC